MCVATRGKHSKDNRNDNDKDEDDDDDGDGAEKQLDDAAGAAAAEGVCVCVANRMKNIFLISCHQYQMKCYSAQAEASLLSPLLSSSFKLLLPTLAILLWRFDSSLIELLPQRCKYASVARIYTVSPLLRMYTYACVAVCVYVLCEFTSLCASVCACVVGVKINNKSWLTKFV